VVITVLFLSVRRNVWYVIEVVSSENNIRLRNYS
jgi:hypothetical protein